MSIIMNGDTWTETVPDESETVAERKKRTSGRVKGKRVVGHGDSTVVYSTGARQNIREGYACRRRRRIDFGEVFGTC